MIGLANATLAAALFFAAPDVSRNPRVAVIYSSWSNAAFKDEYDPHLQKLGWAFEKVENRQIKDWIPSLRQFDIVISSSIGNLENAVDMAAFKEDWLAFLKAGGLLLITDASYGSVLDLWTNRLGPEFSLTSSMCASHKRDKPNPDKVVFDDSSPLLHLPNELPGLLEAKSGIWAHMEPTGSAWTSLATCVDGQSLFVFSDVGKGCLAVMSYYSLKTPAATPLVTGLLENLWLHTEGLQSGLSLTAFDLGEASLGRHDLALGLRNASSAQSSWQVKIEIAEPDSANSQTLEASVALPSGGEAKISLPYVSENRGEVLFRGKISSADQHILSFERRQIIPDAVTLDLPNRHIYPWQKQLPFSVRFSPASDAKLSDCSADALMEGQPTGQISDLQTQMERSSDVSGLAVGEHTLTVRLNADGPSQGEASAKFQVHDMPRVFIRPEDGTAMVDGAPFFPFGWYHVSWTFTSEERLDFLRAIAAGGFNVVHAGIKDMAEWDPFLAEAEKLKVKVVTEFGVDPLQVIPRYRDRWSVLAWNPGDEPDGAGVNPAEMLSRHNAFKDADPDHPSYMTLCVPSAYARYVASAEIIAPDPYPIKHEPSSTETVYSLLTQAHTEAWKLGRPVWGVLQCFGYQDPKSWRVPTFEECRNMTYLALLSGVKGILYYTYADIGFNMKDHSDLWRNMQTLPSEIKALEPWLLNGKLTGLDTGQKDVFAGLWSLDGRHVACVVSAANDGERDVTVSLPETVSGNAEPLFQGKPTGLALRDHQLAGKLGSLDVNVVLIK